MWIWSEIWVYSALHGTLQCDCIGLLSASVVTVYCHGIILTDELYMIIISKCYISSTVTTICTGRYCKSRILAWWIRERFLLEFLFQVCHLMSEVAFYIRPIFFHSAQQLTANNKAFLSFSEDRSYTNRCKQTAENIVTQDCMYVFYCVTFSVLQWFWAFMHCVSKKTGHLLHHGLCGSNKQLYKRCAKSMGRPKFRPPTAPTFFNRS